MEKPHAFYLNNGVLACGPNRQHLKQRAGMVTISTHKTMKLAYRAMVRYARASTPLAVFFEHEGM